MTNKTPNNIVAINPKVTLTITVQAESLKVLDKLVKESGFAKEYLIEEIIDEGAREWLDDLRVGIEAIEKFESNGGRTYTFEEAERLFGLFDEEISRKLELVEN